MPVYRPRSFLHKSISHKPNKGRIDIWAKSYVTWGPRAHEDGHIGGSEQAVIHLAPLLAELGWEVHVYASVLNRLGYERGVHWHHESHFRPDSPRDLLVVWRRAEDLLAAKRASQGRWPVVIWCHDIPNSECLSSYHLADKVLCLSPYQKKLYEHMTRCSSDQIAVLQNGILKESIEKALEKKKSTHKNPYEQYQVFYGSSADRGLVHLIRMWPRVLKQFPHAELHACYSLDLLRLPHLRPVWGRIADTVESYARTEPSFTFHGGLKHKDYLDIAANCKVWAYPTGFDEISCITAMEMQALGLIPVTSDRGALVDTVLNGPMISDALLCQEVIARGARMEGGTWWFPAGAYSPSFLDLLLETLGNPPSCIDLADLALKTYDWTRTAELFSCCFEELINGSQHKSP